MESGTETAETAETAEVGRCRFWWRSVLIKSLHIAYIEEKRTIFAGRKDFADESEESWYNTVCYSHCGVGGDDIV